MKKNNLVKELLLEFLARLQLLKCLIRHDWKPVTFKYPLLSGSGHELGRVCRRCKVREVHNKNIHKLVPLDKHDIIFNL
jgi:hypothetical protein